MPTRNPQELPHAGKIISFDVGSKTIGIATCGIGRTIASPHSTIARVQWKKDKEKIRQIIEAENITCAVVGLPLNMSGELTTQTKSCISFAENIENEFGFPVLLWDERLTTIAAESALFEQRTGRQKRASKKDVKKKVDAVAASLILQGAIDNLRFTQ